MSVCVGIDVDRKRRTASRPEDRFRRASRTRHQPPDRLNPLNDLPHLQNRRMPGESRRSGWSISVAASRTQAGPRRRNGDDGSQGCQPCAVAGRDEGAGFQTRIRRHDEYA